MTTLSRREIFLLFVMAVIVAVGALIMFFINPLRETMLANEVRLAELEYQQFQTDLNLNLIPQLRTRKDARLSETETALDAIADPIHAAEFERWVLPLFAQHNAQVTSAFLSPTQLATPELVYTPINPELYRLLELIYTYNQLNIPVAQVLPESTTQLLFAEYSYELNVSFDNFMEIIDAVKLWDTTFFVSNARYDFAENVASIDIRVYGVHKLTEQELLEIYRGDLGMHPNEVTGPKGTSNPK